MYQYIDTFENIITHVHIFFEYVHGRLVWFGSSLDNMVHEISEPGEYVFNEQYSNEQYSNEQ